PAVHAAHAGAHDEFQVGDVEVIGEQSMLRFNHVGVAIVREFRSQAVGGFGGFSVADVVGEDEEVFGGIEGLALVEGFIAEVFGKESAAVAGGAVEDEDGVLRDSFVVGDWFTEGAVMNTKFGEGFAGGELKIGDDVIALINFERFGGAADG